MKKTIRVVVIVVVAIGLLGVVGWRVAAAVSERKDAERGVEVPARPVSVVAVEARDIVARVTMTGTIRPQNEAPIFTKVPGRVAEVLVGVGDQVEADQVLAVIEHREIELQSDQAQAGVQVAEAQLERAQIGLDAATTAFSRLEGLRDDGAIPQSEFEKIEYGLRDAKASMAAAEAGVATARAAAALAAQMVDNSSVTTPISGTVTHRFVNVGSPAGQTMPVFQVQDLSVLKLDSNATATDFAKLQVGQDVEVTVADLPGVAFPGTVATLSPSLNPMTRHAAVEISIANPDGRLLPNMFATGVIEVEKLEAVPAIPKRAILTLEEGEVVFVVRDGLAVKVKPVLGARDQGFVAVESGLEVGDIVIVSGQSGVRDGEAVSVIAAEPAGDAAAVTDAKSGDAAVSVEPSRDVVAPDTDETAGDAVSPTADVPVVEAAP